MLSELPAAASNLITPTSSLEAPSRAIKMPSALHFSTLADCVYAHLHLGLLPQGGGAWNEHHQEVYSHSHNGKQMTRGLGV